MNITIILCFGFYYKNIVLVRDNPPHMGPKKFVTQSTPDCVGICLQKPGTAGSTTCKMLSLPFLIHSQRNPEPISHMICSKSYLRELSTRVSHNLLKILPIEEPETRNPINQPGTQNLVLVEHIYFILNFSILICWVPSSVF